jgi:hypothetical protein
VVVPLPLTVVEPIYGSGVLALLGVPELVDIVSAGVVGRLDPSVSEESGSGPRTRKIPVTGVTDRGKLPEMSVCDEVLVSELPVDRLPLVLLATLVFDLAIIRLNHPSFVIGGVLLELSDRLMLPEWSLWLP